MNEEEKKTIERIEDTFYNNLAKGIKDFQKITLYEDSIQDIRMLLNLIEKLQKENEELKAFTKSIFDEDIEKEFIRVQKVKDKIEEYKKMLLSCNRFSDIDRIKAINERILELQELLESEE